MEREWKRDSTNPTRWSTSIPWIMLRQNPRTRTLLELVGGLWTPRVFQCWLNARSLRSKASSKEMWEKGANWGVGPPDGYQRGTNYCRNSSRTVPLILHNWCLLCRPCRRTKATRCKGVKVGAKARFAIIGIRIDFWACCMPNIADSIFTVVSAGSVTRMERSEQWEIPQDLACVLAGKCDRS